LLFEETYMVSYKSNQYWKTYPDYCGGILPPGVKCSGTNSYTWDGNVHLVNGSYESNAKLLCGSTESVSFNLPAEFHNGPITISIPEYVSADGYTTRAGKNQVNETWYIEYYRGGKKVGQTNCTEDVQDGVNYAWSIGTLDAVTLDSGADEFRIVHCGCSSGGAQSVHATGICFDYTVCAPQVTVCNEGACPMQLVEWLPGGDDILGTINAGGCMTITGYEGMKLRYINTDHLWSDLLYDESQMVSGCSDVSYVANANYCLPNCIFTCPPNQTISCEDSVDPSNTGAASVSGANCIDPIVTYTDEYDGNACPQVITRTWTLNASIPTLDPCVPQTVAAWDFSGQGSQGLCAVYGYDPLLNGVPATHVNGTGCSSGFSVGEVQKDGKSSCVQGAFGAPKSAACVGGQDTNGFQNLSVSMKDQ